jgi:hypothetical protein
MNNTMNSRRNTSRKERMQQRLDAGFVETVFPGVASIAVSMVYSQRGIAKALPRTVNFFPSSYALFRVDCLNKSCIDGGFDLTDVITSMVKNGKEKAKGDLSCDGEGVSGGHSTIVYEVAIEYV